MHQHLLSFLLVARSSILFAQISSDSITRSKRLDSLASVHEVGRASKAIMVCRVGQSTPKRTSYLPSSCVKSLHRRVGRRLRCRIPISLVRQNSLFTIITSLATDEGRGSWHTVLLCANALDWRDVKVLGRVFL